MTVFFIHRRESPQADITLVLLDTVACRWKRCGRGPSWQMMYKKRCERAAMNVVSLVILYRLRIGGGMVNSAPYRACLLRYRRCSIEQK